MTHFTLSARKMLAELLQQKTSYREIKKIIGIGISSVSDEMKRNSENGRYDPHIAQRKAMQRQVEKTKRTKIQISERPRFVELRDEIRHYEGDLMQFSSCGKTLAVFVERMSRKVCIVVNEDKSASEMEMAIHEMICQFGQRNMKTLTLDNGKENVCHQKVREDYMESFDTFFCDSYCSWQKGAVENMNKLIRQYFPRDLPPENITQDFADMVAEKLNSRPRKCLNYETPSFVFQKCSV